MSSLNTLLNFMRLTHEAHKVERVARIPGEKRYATMVEHSWQLSVLAWYVIDTENLHLNKELIFKYTLVHDLVEAYAGDTYAYGIESASIKEKDEREAAERIKKEHPDFKDLHKTIIAYEKRNDAESKFVYALDKLIDPLNIYLENGLLHHEKRVTLDTLLKYKTPKVSIDPTVKRIFDELVQIFKENEAKLFYIPK